MPPKGPSKDETERIIERSRSYADEFVMRSRLGEIIEKRGLAQRDVYRMTGVHPSLLKRLIDNTTSRIDFDTMKRLSIGLNVSINDLFVIDATDEKTPSAE